MRMSQQQVLHTRSPSGNGFGRRRVDRETRNRLDNKLQSAMVHYCSFPVTDLINGSKDRLYECSSHDRLLFLTTSFIGQIVEIQVKNGSVFTGVFHATSAEREFGVILKMARLTKDSFFKGQSSCPDFAGKPTSKTLIIPSKELVQVIAKDVPLTSGITPGHSGEKQQDIMTDSLISQSYYVEIERELQRWVPDEEMPQCPELENIFDNTWNRNWDQFEANEALFGVKSTFDEELYTTKLERGPQMQELERKALRIAKEIEGEETQDLHLAEERGIHSPEDFGIDEESRFSSVYRGADDGIFEEHNEALLDTCNDETFGVPAKPNTLVTCCSNPRSSYRTEASSGLSSVCEESFSFSSDMSVHLSSSTSYCRKPVLEFALNGSSVVDDTIRVDKNEANDQSLVNKLSKDTSGGKLVSEEGQSLKLEGSSCSVEISDSLASGKESMPIQAAVCQTRPGSSSSTSECVASTSVSSGPALSPSSSVGSLSSEKSTLNPYAKEFKLNPNAKSFTPFVTPSRPPVHASEGLFYLPTNVSTFPHMPGVPLGIGVGHPFGGHQPIIYNAQAATVPLPQGYYTNAPYGQQMFIGQPREVLYMRSYTPEMAFK